MNGDLEAASVTSIVPSASAADVKRLIKSTRPTSVKRQWQRVSSVLIYNLGVEYVGADENDIVVAESVTCAWPAEVRELYRCVDRASDRRGMMLLPPGFELMSIANVVQLHGLWMRLSLNPAYGVPVDLAADMAKPAGSPASTMLSGFVPFASSLRIRCSSILVLVQCTEASIYGRMGEFRPGCRSGCR